MAKKRTPVTVAGIREKTKASPQAEPTQTAKTARPETSAADAYSFVASKFRKEDGEGGPIWNAATQTFEFLFHVPTDVKKHGAVGAGRKYLSNLFYFLGRQVADN